MAKKSTAETVWIWKESLRQLYEGAAPELAGKKSTAVQRLRSPGIKRLGDSLQTLPARRIKKD